MKTKMAETSLSAFEILKTTNKEKMVLQALKLFGKPCSSLMLEEFCIENKIDLRRNTITGRFHSLEEKRVLSTQVKKCEVSGNNAKFYGSVV